MDKKQELVIFETEDNTISLSVPLKDDSVWLNRNQMSELFGRDDKTIGKHIKNALNEELDDSTVAKFATVQKEGNREVKRDIEYFNLDVIISVGYRVKSKRGIEFRKWANKVLKQYIIDGIAINEKRLDVLQKTINIQSKMLAGALEIDEEEVLRAINEYSDALCLLDKYDHHKLTKPNGNKPIYRLTYDDCKNMVSKMQDSFNTDVFGIEKEPGKVAGIIDSIYQSAFGEDAYPTIEEKASNLLYFMIKDHPYADGCKRIGASLFLEFLDRNNVLFNNNVKRLSDGTLVAITLMIAESKPEEKDVMVSLVMNLL